MGELHNYLKSYGMPTAETLDNYHLLVLMLNACFTQQYGLFTYVLQEFKNRFALELLEFVRNTSGPDLEPQHAGQYAYRVGNGVYKAVPIDTGRSRDVIRPEPVKDTAPVKDGRDVRDTTTKYKQLEEKLLGKKTRWVPTKTRSMDPWTRLNEPPKNLQIADGYVMDLDGSIVPRERSVFGRLAKTEPKIPEISELHTLPTNVRAINHPMYVGPDGNARFVYPPPESPKTRDLVSDLEKTSVTFDPYQSHAMATQKKAVGTARAISKIREITRDVTDPSSRFVKLEPEEKVRVVLPDKVPFAPTPTYTKLSWGSSTMCEFHRKYLKDFKSIYEPIELSTSNYKMFATTLTESSRLDMNEFFRDLSGKVRRRRKAPQERKVAFREAAEQVEFEEKGDKDAAYATESQWTGIGDEIGESPDASDEDQDIDDEYYGVVEEMDYQIIVESPDLYPLMINNYELQWQMTMETNIQNAIGSVAEFCYDMPVEAYRYLLKCSNGPPKNHQILHWTYYVERRMLLLLASMTSTAYVEYTYGGDSTMMNHMLRLSKDELPAMIKRWGRNGPNPVDTMSAIAMIADIALTSNENSNNYFIGEGGDDSDRFCSFKEIDEYDPNIADDANVALLEEYLEMNTENGDPMTDPANYAGNITEMTYVGDRNYYAIEDESCEIGEYCILRYPPTLSKFSRFPLLFDVNGVVCSYIDQDGTVWENAELRTVDSVSEIESIEQPSGVNTTVIGAVSVLEKNGFLNGRSVEKGTKVVCVAQGCLILQSSLFRGNDSIDTIFADKGRKRVADGWWLTTERDKQIVGGEKIDIITTKIFDCGAVIRYLSGATIELEDPTFAGITTDISKAVGLRFMPSTIREVEEDDVIDAEKEDETINRFERQYNETILGCLDNMMGSVIKDMQNNTGRSKVLQAAMDKHTRDFIAESRTNNKGMFQMLNDYTKPNDKIKERGTDEQYMVLDKIKEQLKTLQDEDSGDKILIEAGRDIENFHLDLDTDPNADRGFKKHQRSMEAILKAGKTRLYRSTRATIKSIQDDDYHLKKIGRDFTKADIDALFDVDENEQDDYCDGIDFEVGNLDDEISRQAVYEEQAVKNNLTTFGKKVEDEADLNEEIPDYEDNMQEMVRDANYDDYYEKNYREDEYFETETERAEVRNILQFNHNVPREEARTTGRSALEDIEAFLKKLQKQVPDEI